MASVRTVTFVVIVCTSTVVCFLDTTLFSSVPFKKTNDVCAAAGNYEGFSWENCNKIPVPVILETLNVSVHPFVLDRPFCFNATINIKNNVGENNNPIEGYLSVKMMVDGEYTELCDLDPEVCYKEDVCQFLKEYQHRCPGKLKKDLHNCTCPFPKQLYKLSRYFPVVIDKPPFGISGSFKVTIVARENGRDIGCVVFYFCVNHC